MRLLTTFAVFAGLGVSALAMPPVPRPAKEFDFIDAAGKHVLLSSLKGKVVIVQGLLTTCPHCQAFSQILSKMQTEYGAKGFQAMGVGMDATPDTVQRYITDYHVNFPVAYASSDTLLSFLGHSAAERLMVPQVVIIDKKGVIQAESAASGTAELQTEANIRVWIEKLLGLTAHSKAIPPAAPKQVSGN